MAGSLNKALESPSDLSEKRQSVDANDDLSTLPSLARTGALGSPAQPLDHGNDDTAEKADGSETASQTSAYIPQKYRWIAFSMIIFFATGSSFAEGTLGPLKSTLVKQLKINSE
jgi:hypothetical protein